jgi:hydrogenase nickel incorporation protein HypA/HybF
MHELSIARSIVETISAAAAEAGAARVLTIRLQLGALAGVVEDALQFSFALVAADTAAEGATLEVVHQPVVIFCATCAAERELPNVQRFRCPVCDTPSGQLVRGRELELIGFEVVEEEPAWSHG